jgi:hypothetical protein
MAKVWIAVNGGSANVHTGKGRVDGLKKFLFTCKGIVNKKLVFHKIGNSGTKVKKSET